MKTIWRWILDITVWLAGLLASMLLIAHEAMAGGSSPGTPPQERWKTECGSCHLAYPPALLPADGWKRLMSQLEQHFGTDASLDPAAANEISAYLQRHSDAGRRTSATPESLRITQTPWFIREHDEVPQASWKHPAVKSAANCAACHTTAAQGDFRERNIRLPR